MGMRGDACQVKYCVTWRDENCEMFKKIFQGVTTCHDEIVKCICVTLGVSHFVNSS